jgi:hypothetical protein
MNRTPGFELEKPAAEQKTPEQLAAEKKAADEKAAADAAAAVASKTPEQIAAEKKAADEKAAAEAAGEPNPLDKLGPLPVETLAKAITDNPTLTAELEKAGIDSELLYETSRRAAQADQFFEIYPDVDSAKFAAESAQRFYDIEDGFPKIKTVEDLDSFITKTMLPLSTLYGQDGKPLMAADGKTYQTDGSIANFFDATSQMETIMAARAADALIAQAAKIAGEEGERAKEQAERIKDAIVLAQQFRDAGYRIPPPKGTGPKRSPEDQATIDKLTRENQEAERVRLEGQQAELKAFDDGVLTDTTTATSGFIAGVLNRTALTDYDKSNIAEKVNAAAWEALEKNRHFQARKASLQSLAATPENRKALVTLARTAFEHEALKFLETEIAQAGGKIMTRQQQRKDKIETQKADDRMNQGGSTTTAAKPAAPMTAGEIRAQAIKNLKASGNAYPDDGEILAESLRLRKAALPTA